MNVLIDLIDALLQLHTVELSGTALRDSLEQLTAYLDRFRTRLNTVNSIHLKRLLLFLKALNDLVESRAATDEVISVSKFVEGLGNKVNGINIHELQSYLITSKVCFRSAMIPFKQVTALACRSRGKSAGMLR